MIMRWFFLSMLVLLGYLSIASDSIEGDSTHNKYYFFTGMKVHYGFIVTHTREIAEITKSNPYSLQVDMGWHLNSQKAYDFCNCYPRIGLSLSWWNFQNPNILGNGLHAIFFLEPFLAASRRVSFSIRPGIGIAFLTKPYDSISNPLNLSYSTHLAFALYLNSAMYLRLNSRLVLNAAFNINHISNGGTKLPNKGLNYPSFSMGIDYSIKPQSFTNFNRSKTSYSKQDQWFFTSMFVGFKSTAFDNETYYILGTQVKYTFQVGSFSAISGGLELLIDGARKSLVEQYGSIHKNAPYIGSVTSGYEHIMGRFRLTFDLGLYFYHMDRGDLLYQRYGVKYRLYKSVFFGLNLKAHRQHAEFFDIRLGLKI